MPEMPYEPMLCQVGTQAMLEHLPSGWIIEPKYDGQRIIAEQKLGVVNLWTRRRKNVTKKFPEVVEKLKLLPHMDWILDGELVCPNGFTDILKRNTEDAFKIGLLAKKIPATYWVFDILKLGEMLMVSNLVLSERKAILEDFLKESDRVQRVRPIVQHNREAQAFFEGYTKGGGEGVILKRLESMYEPDARSAHWIKVKKQEVVDVFVIGATRSDAGLPFASLILAKDGEYFGKVGTGFSDRDRTEILEMLKAHSDGVQRFSLPAQVKAELLIECAPIEAEITLMETIKSSPRFPVWVRFRTEGE
jgi:DNA ligase-1